MSGGGIFIDRACVRNVDGEASVGSDWNRCRPEVQVAAVEAATGRATLVDLSGDEVCDEVPVSSHVELEVRYLRCQALVMAWLRVRSWWWRRRRWRRRRHGR